MIVKSIDREDVAIIDALNKLQDFKLNTINNAIIHKIAYEGKLPIAYGIAKRMAEAIILVNLEAPIISRAKAMRELMQFAEMGAKREGCEQLHCFVSDAKLANTLESKFGFVKSESIVMVKNL